VGGGLGISSRKANSMDFPLEQDARRLVDAAPDLLAETLDVRGRGTSSVDQEVGVLL
jgi:serine kinase of HPr protein (carbohydrate metabolism regulator)